MSSDRGVGNSHRRIAARQGDCVAMATGIIRREFPDRILLPVIAQELGIDRYELSRRFKSAMGVTFREYVLACRISTACELLRAQDHSITEIAQLAGFGDLPRLDKVFRGRMGMSPREYRLRHGPSGPTLSAKNY